MGRRPKHAYLVNSPGEKTIDVSLRFRQFPLKIESLLMQICAVENRPRNAQAQRLLESAIKNYVKKYKLKFPQNDENGGFD